MVAQPPDSTPGLILDFTMPCQLNSGTLSLNYEHRLQRAVSIMMLCLILGQLNSTNKNNSLYPNPVPLIVGSLHPLHGVNGSLFQPSNQVKSLHRLVQRTKTSHEFFKLFLSVHSGNGIFLRISVT